MIVVCLDLEGVLVPEIWINVAKKTGIEELTMTTRDEPDYDVLMKKRIGILKEHSLRLPDIQEVIKTMDPLPGAENFLQELRSQFQVIILSDTFTQFADPLMKKLLRPTLFCNSLIMDGNNAIIDYKLRQKDGKKHAVKALQSIGFTTIASGDSYNDVTMLQTADGGVFFRPPDTITAEFPQFSVCEEYPELMNSICSLADALEKESVR